MTGRLIDANELFVKWQTTMMKIGEPVSVVYILAAMSDLQQAPTVEAIPIEYIESTMNRWKEIIGYEESVDALRILIDNWKIERTEE